MWVDKYVGLKYDAKNFDCAHLVALVLQEQKGIDVNFPQTRRGLLREADQQKAIAAYSESLAKRVHYPEDFCGVLMREVDKERAGHIGLYLTFAHTAYVLHNSEALGKSCVHRLDELSRFGIIVEGYYTWTAPPSSTHASSMPLTPSPTRA